MENEHYVIDTKDIKRARMNIYLVKELKDYIDTQARNFGLSTSAFMTMVIQNYRIQNDALSNLNNVNDLMEKFKKLQNNDSE